MAGSIPPHIKSIAIPLVLNQTAEFGIAEQITDDLQSKFIEENILKVRSDEDSDSILRGTVVSVEDKVHTYSQAEAVTEYRLTIRMELEWYDVAKDESLLIKSYTGWGAYGLSGDISTDGIDNDGDNLIDGDDEDEIGEPREFATRVAVTKIAEDVISDIVASW
ncbi:MAG: LptE family protein [Candidatus Marinimicrobia bacterium]|nr:LptE family protein [Candidatus Neomarinimicrobiota bacterium]